MTDEQHEKELAAEIEIIKSGITGEFWATLKKILLRRQEEAVYAMRTTPPDKWGEIAKFQAMANNIDDLICTIEGFNAPPDPQDATPE